MKQLPPFFVPIVKSSDSKSKLKLWDLKWNKQVILSGVAYPICVAKKNGLVKAGTHQKKLFTIELHK